MARNDQLNEEQQLAVETLEGPLLVLAGAGSGKTRVVTMRIARLIELGVTPLSIIALTFTNKAAEEMRSRVRDLVGRDVLASTFHSLGARILREYGREVGLEVGFTIYDEKDSEAVLKSCFESLGVKDDKGYLKSIKHQISQMKNEIVSPAEIGHQSANKMLTGFREIYQLYQERLLSYNAVDFDDLLFLTVKFFQTSPLAAAYKERFAYVLVDEYQDTNHAQYMICKHLAEKSGNICVVGDPDQAIYSWRGADVDNILNFEKDFPGAKVTTLRKNYRSTNTILKAAGALIDHNQRPYSKELYSDLGEGEKVGIHFFPSDREEVKFVVEKVAQYLRQYSPEEIVVFYRTNAQSRLFEDALLSHRIPYTIIGGLSFYMRKEIKDLLAFLRLSTSPRDFMSFSRVINLPKRGFGPKALEQLKEASEKKAIPILFLLQRDDLGFKFSGKQRENLNEFLAIIGDIQRIAAGDTPLQEVISFAIERTNYLALLEEDPETAEDRKENIEELIAKAAEWSEGREEGKDKLPHFLEELTLATSVETSDKRASSIRLMTLHNGKGLEFDVCFMVGMEEDLFPHTHAKGGDGDIEEERRLCYVGMTRAKKHLHMSCAAFRFIWGGAKTMDPSRFLGEIPEELTVRKEPRGYTATYHPEPFSEEQSQEGQIVIHKEFGKGVIEREYETSLGKTFDIKFFVDGQRRSLVAKFAKLTFI